MRVDSLLTALTNASPTHAIVTGLAPGTETASATQRQPAPTIAGQSSVAEAVVRWASRGEQCAREDET